MPATVPLTADEIAALRRDRRRLLPGVVVMALAGVLSAAAAFVFLFSDSTHSEVFQGGLFAFVAFGCTREAVKMRRWGVQIGAILLANTKRVTHTQVVRIHSFGSLRNPQTRIELAGLGELLFVSVGSLIETPVSQLQTGDAVEAHLVGEAPLFLRLTRIPPTPQA
ncbi:hypothetical protein Q9Q94_16305 [Uliginosibacterium sp. 31-16]|uniref:hypothetical protein n=1 Tax=Uliginosibacterium sp. 31-16 TaxID=3068315 RepID=UPI00273FA96D|nr:hypothetical protein [Uliginosibacterium sp. 31-16]MDP5241105.1 hypothetical protein [Uliginosibacterium sp. 31-16]